MRALLFYPPQLCLEEAVRIWSFSHLSNFPLAPFRLATDLRRRGYEIDFVDALNVYENTEAATNAALSEERIDRHAPCGNFAEEKRTKPVYRVGLDPRELEGRLAELSPPEEIYVSSIFTWSWKTTHESIALLRRVFPKATIRLGGIYPMLCPERAAGAGADEIVRGPVPAVESSRLDTELLARVPRLDGVVLKTSVGCPYGCSYCAVHVLEGKKFVFRDPGEVLEEMESIHEAVGVSNFHFWESNLLLEPESHLLPLLRNVIDRRLGFTFQAPEGFQPGCITADVAVLLKATGFREIRLTLETTQPDRLKESGRPWGVSAVETALENLLAAGFLTSDISVVLLIGQPGQSLDHVLRDVIRVYGLGIAATFLVYSPIPQTRDYHRLRDQLRGRALEDFDSFLYPLANPELTTVQLDAVLKYFNDRFLPLRRIAASPTEDTLVRRMQELIADGGTP